MPEEGFRHQAWGFNKDDVLAYVNALVNEAQQQQLTYEEQARQLQSQIDKLKKEQQNARACVEKLQSDLLQQTNRAETAEHNLAESEKKLADCQEQLTVSESRANGYQGRYQQSQKTMLEWQNKCHSLEEQLENARSAAAQAAVETATPAAPAEQPAPAPEPEPEEPVAPAPQPQQPARTDPDAQASVQARKILADARIYADTAARRMQQEADRQKARMAENARDLAAGVLVLRERLNRVDEKLAAATMDLENATAAIYAALDHTDSDLQALGVKMDAFATGTPESDEPQPAPAPAQPPEQPTPASPPEQPRPAAQPARRVRPVPKAKPVKPAVSTRRLRNVQDGSRRAVTQSLLDAINRAGGGDDQ